MSRARAQQVLDKHNCQRARYGVPPLEWDWKLAEDAKKWANNCKWGHSTNASRPGQGENLAASSSNVNCDGWVAEEKDWKCGVPYAQSCKAMCGHYSQMVWGTTKKLGCAINRCPGGFPPNDYLVCRYSPPGNYSNQKPTPKCDPDNSINCRNPSQGNFPRPRVPPLPGTPAEVEQELEQEEAAVPATVRQQPDYMEQRRRRREELQEKWRAQRARENEEDERILKQERQQQQEAVEQNTMEIDGITIYYVPQMKEIIDRLSDEKKKMLAERLKHIPPFHHPHATSLFLQQLSRKAVGIKQLYPRRSQRALLNQLNKEQYDALWQHVKDLPTSVQHCGIEEFLVNLGIAKPTQLCMQAREHMQAAQQEADEQKSPGEKEAVQEAVDRIISEKDIVVPPELQDTKELTEDDPVEVRAFAHESVFEMPWYGWVAVAVASILVVAALVWFVITVINRRKNNNNIDSSSGLGTGVQSHGQTGVGGT